MVIKETSIACWPRWLINPLLGKALRLERRHAVHRKKIKDYDLGWMLS
jgi:hypothetical protein